MRIVCISDTHRLHNKVSVPDGDLLIHAGDITRKGEIWAVKQFAGWLKTLPHKHKVVIAGNHDFCFQDEYAPKAREYLTDFHYLEDDQITIDGFKIYGAPWQPWYHDWAFNIPRGEAIRQKWEMIPDDTNILVTHGPPWEILDWVERPNPDDPVPGVPRVGCEELAERVKQLSELKLHVFGHIHESYGKVKRGNTLFVNASTCTLQYAPTNKPIVIELNERR